MGQVVLVANRSRIVGRQEAGCAEAVIHCSQLSRARVDDVVPWIKRVVAKTMPCAQLSHFVEAHGRRHRELHDPRHWNGQALVVVEAAKQTVQFIPRWPSVTFGAFADESKSLQCDAGEVNWL